MKPLSFSFEPDPARAARLDGAMHAALADSLEYLAREWVASGNGTADPFGTLSAQMRAGKRFGPEVFGRYYQQVFAITDGDEPLILATQAALKSARPVDPGMQYIVWGDPTAQDLLGVMADRMGSDELAMDPPEAADSAAFLERIDKGLALLDLAQPDLADEIRAIVRRIVIARGRPVDATTKMEFDGASHYQLWGLLLLNTKFHKTPLAMAEVLAHESAHSLLFGFTIDEALTLNDDDETFVSPLRIDPRPMDGIYHATFVSARMCLAMQAIANCKALDSAIRAEATVLMNQDIGNFAKGYRVVAEHGRLSAPGQALIDHAKAFMDQL